MSAISMICKQLIEKEEYEEEELIYLVFYYYMYDIEWKFLFWFFFITISGTRGYVLIGQGEMLEGVNGCEWGWNCELFYYIGLSGICSCPVVGVL